MSEPTPEAIAGLIAASPDIRPEMVRQAAENLEYLSGMATSWLINGDEFHGSMLQCLCLAFGFQQTEIEQLRMKNTNQRALLKQVRETANQTDVPYFSIEQQIRQLVADPNDRSQPFQGMAVCARCGDKRCPGASGQPCTNELSVESQWGKHALISEHCWHEMRPLVMSGTEEGCCNCNAVREVRFVTRELKGHGPYLPVAARFYVDVEIHGGDGPCSGR